MARGFITVLQMDARDKRIIFVEYNAKRFKLLFYPGVKEWFHLQKPVRNKKGDVTEKAKVEQMKVADVVNLMRASEEAFALGGGWV